MQAFEKPEFQAFSDRFLSYSGGFIAFPIAKFFVDVKNIFSCL
jgi:hypothetical protein